LFGSIDEFLRRNGFELLNFDYRGQGRFASTFAEGDIGGQLLSTDAVWIKPLDSFLVNERHESPNAIDVVRMAIFLVENNATDMSANLLLRGSSRGVDFSAFYSDSLWKHLRNNFLMLGKKLSYVPQFQFTEFQSFFLQIFGDEFPTEHKFWKAVRPSASDSAPALRLQRS